MNDHQVQIVRQFVSKNYILAYNDGDDLGKIIKSINQFKPKKFGSNTNTIINIIEKYIDNN